MKYLALVLPLALFAVFKWKSDSVAFQNDSKKTSSLQLPRKERVVNLKKISLSDVEFPEAQPLVVQKSKSLLEEEMSTLYSQEINWTEHEAALKEKIQQLSQAELQALGQQAMTQTMNHDQRTLAIYILSLAGQRARAVLTQIALVPVPSLADVTDPHSEKARNHEFETALRISALTSLDALSLVSATEVQKNMEQILSTQNSPTLQNLARISLIGIQQGRPGKLARFHESNQF